MPSSDDDDLETDADISDVDDIGDGKVEQLIKTEETELVDNTARVGLADQTRPPVDPDEQERQWLALRGYTPEVIAKGNRMFKKNTLLDLKVKSLIANRKANTLIAERLQKFKLPDKNLMGSPRCLPGHMLTGVKHGFSQKLIKRFNGRNHFSLKAHRLVAIYKPADQGGLSDDEMWKAVARFDYMDATCTSALYDASARCNVFNSSSAQHCCRAEHLNLETRFRNCSTRKAHQHGLAGCFCEQPCLGYVRQTKYLKISSTVH